MSFISAATANPKDIPSLVADAATVSLYLVPTSVAKFPHPSLVSLPDGCFFLIDKPYTDGRDPTFKARRRIYVLNASVAAPTS
jgi:hypothetical protein